MEYKTLVWLDQQPPARECVRCIENEGFSLYHATDLYQGLDFTTDNQPELIIIDADQTTMPMVEMVKLLHKRHKSAQIICLVDASQSSLASEALDSGAVDYLLKPYILSQLQQSVRNIHTLKKGMADMVAESHVSQQLLRLANRAAQTNTTVLIQGPSGTGKERLAHFIHTVSERAHKPFVAVNCAAIPDNMLEATLFGYNKGAFTGAVAGQSGKFELAEGGTLLLDEISELPFELQGKLLRVLQEREVERLGSHQRIQLDVRIVAACNRDLAELVAQGQFREDLYYRLNVLPLQWPALRDRRDDILPLAAHFIDRYGAGKHCLSDDARNVMLSYNWPGNVRELENIIQRAIVMARGIEIRVEDLGLPKCNLKAAELCANHVQDTKKQAEFDYIFELLQQFRGHRSRTANALGVSTRALRYKLAAMRESGMDVDAIA